MPIFLSHTAKSLPQYLRLVSQIQQSWAGKNTVPDPWFRGMSNVSHVLLPGWYRLGKRRKGVDEDDLVDEFQRRAIPLVEGTRPESSWEWYFLMQHYGLPTRLLDWSESALVGLYFAIGDWKGVGGTPMSDAVVWMLDPWYLNQWAHNKNEVFRYDEGRVARYLPKTLWGAHRLVREPIALMPLYNSRRITAQRGVFTIHGSNQRPLEQMLPSRKAPHFVKIVIPQNNISAMRDDLRLAGVTDATLFPEMAYLCQDILHAWGLL